MKGAPILKSFLPPAALAAVLFLLRAALRAPEPVPSAAPPLEEVRRIFPGAARVFPGPAERFGVENSGGVPLGTVIDATAAAARCPGYGGPVPLLIGVDPDGCVCGVSLLSNRETPAYRDFAVERGLLDSWNGVPGDEAARLDVEAVSGATITSSAVIATVRSGLSGAGPAPDMLRRAPAPWPAWLALALNLAVFFLPRTPGKIRFAVSAATFAVLGVWSGGLLSLELARRWLVGEPGNASHPLAVFLLAAAAVSVAVNLATGRNFYCARLCPFGAAQDLVRKAGPSPRAVSAKPFRAARSLRMIFLAAAAAALLAGWEGDLAGFEPFAAFRPPAAPLSSLILAGSFLLLSFFVPRPWCRSLCPTGALFQILARRRPRNDSGEERPSS
ncbi:MAG TPA: 4Fe-4S binding protein [bacterium]|nr:4Fe-4S binding protein [bacterium]